MITGDMDRVGGILFVHVVHVGHVIVGVLQGIAWNRALNLRNFIVSTMI